MQIKHEHWGQDSQISSSYVEFCSLYDILITVLFQAFPHYFEGDLAMRRKLSVALLTILILSVFFQMLSFSLAAPSDEEPADELTILFTHDLQSNLMPFIRMDSDTPTSVGGFARIKTQLDKHSENKDTLIVDAGDFSMGTIFQTIYDQSASELRLLGKMGFDAVTLGNHEFDFMTQGLSDMLHTAANSGDKLPALIFNPGGLAVKDYTNPITTLDDLGDALYAVNMQQTMIIEKNGIKVGIFSAFGNESIDFSPTLELDLPDYISASKKAVAELKASGAEIIVCLSHSGTKDEKKNSEDEQLAAAVKDIDVIISGHTHTFLYEPIISGNTIIGSCGENGQSLGKLVVKKNGNRWQISEYELIPIDESTPEDAAINSDIYKYKAIVEQRYLSRFGDYTFDKIIGYAGFPTLRQSDVYDYHKESLLGNLIADSYIYAAGGDEPVIAIAPAGTIRWSLPMGNITLPDVFTVNSLGIGQDGVSGYPLIDAYLTGKELLNAAEVDASITPMMKEAQLFISGMHFSFNPKRLIFNKVTDAYLLGSDGQRIEIEETKLYRIICGLYSAQMLGSVKAKSFGILSITPKDENGNEITDFYSRILRYENGSEIKEWFALASYISSFDKNAAGVATIPDYYSEYHERKVVETETGLIFFTNMNTFSRIVFSVILLVIILIAYIVYRIATRRKRKSWKKGKRRSRAI